MPNLMDMFQPQNAAGEPVGFGDALQSRSNSLIGLGLGMLQPSRPLAGESSYGNMLQGYMGGAGLDARTAAQAQHAAQERARLKLAQQQANREPEALRIMRATGIDPASPEGRTLLYPKAEEWKPGSVTYRDQQYPYQENLRTGEYRWGPLGQPGQRPAAPSTAAPYSGGAAVPFVDGGTPSPSGTLPATSAGGAAAATPTGAIPAPLPGMEDEPWSVQKAVRQKQLEEHAKTQVKDPQQIAAAQKSAADVLTAINTAEKQAINKGGLLPTTGVLGGKLTQVYQPSADLAATLETIAANVSLDKLTAMRAASPTGASGLGAVTEGEHALLQASIAAVKQSQSQEQLQANLKRVRATYDWIINRTDKNAPPPFSLRPQTEASGGGGKSGTTNSGIKWTVE